MKSSYAILIVFVLSACNLSQSTLSQSTGGGLQAGIDAPTNGAVLPLAPYTLVAHASDPTGITQVEFSVDGAVIGTVPGTGSVLVAQQAWTPSAAGPHLIQARAQNASGTWSPYAEARVTVQGQAGQNPPGAGETPTLAVTATETLTPTPSFTETPSVATLTLTLNANCRRGPSQVYDVLTSLLKGQSVPIKAKSEDETWWLVRIPTGELCWISGAIATTGGNLDTLPVATGQPGCLVVDAELNEVCTIPCPKKNPKPADLCTP